MTRPTHFHTLQGNQIPLPVFFPDATRAVLKNLDSVDIESTKTPGILVNTLHLVEQPGKSVIKSYPQGIRDFMSWGGGVISDSGGFQVMSIAKTQSSHPVSDHGVKFLLNHKKIMFTPKMSIDLQLAIKSDMMVVLDDFTPPNATSKVARETVERTILWAIECKKIFAQATSHLDTEKRPYLLGVVQGGFFPDLRRECTERLVEIGFDGLGFGGWPIDTDKQFDYQTADIIRRYSPNDYLLYGLGVGKPDEIARLVKTGWHIFDCVLPTRDARHKRLYVYSAKTIGDIDLNSPKFYHYYTPDKEQHYRDSAPVSTACDCLLCTRYSRSYLHHLFKIGDFTAGRLATIHNLRFYSILMEKLRFVFHT